MKTLLNNKELFIYLIIMLMFGLIALFQYTFPGTMEDNELKEIELILASEPEYKSGGEYSDPELIFEAKGYEVVFKLKEGAAVLSRDKRIKELSTGDRINILVFIEELEHAKSSVEIYQIKNPEGQAIFSLSNYNYLKRNSWKGIWLPVLIFNLIMIVPFVNKTIRRKKM